MGFIIVKGKFNEIGIIWFEWEDNLNIKDVRVFLNFCEFGIIEKIRYEVFVGKFLYEVDEFYGENEGLVIVEIEFKLEIVFF